MRSYPPRAISSPFRSMSRSLYLKEVLPRLATRTSMVLHRGLTSGRAVRGEQFGMRTRDDVRGDQFADASGRFRAGFDRRAHAADVAADDRRHERAADLDRLDDLDVGGLGHRIRRLNERDPALGLDEPQGVSERT